jgi:hypothetical protein
MYSLLRRCFRDAGPNTKLLSLSPSFSIHESGYQALTIYKSLTSFPREEAGLIFPSPWRGADGTG